MSGENGRWLLSGKASALFLLSSIVVLATGALVVTLGELLSFDVSKEISSRPALYLPLAVLLGVNFFSAAFLVVGMLLYWVRFDNSRRLAKLLWLGSFIALGWYSMAIYYFVVYRRRRSFATDANP